MNGGQFLPDLRWLTAAYVASRLHVSLATPNSSVKAAPGVHGHRMDSCSVGSTTLQSGASATIPASPPPTFTCQFTNDGQNQETNVVVKVTVSGTSASGQTTVPQTTPGVQSTATITLGSSPPAGTYTVSATIEKVPGETVTTHNTQTYQLTFQ
jgi:CARDB protein